MASFDSKNDVNQLLALNSQTIASSTTVVGTEIDTLGYNSLTFLPSLGARTDGTFTILVQDSDVSGSGFADVADDFLVGTEALAALTASNTIKKIGYVGKKRYVKCSMVSTLVTSGSTGVQITAVQGDPRHAPVA
jgi:hypothetical protein